MLFCFSTQRKRKGEEGTSSDQVTDAKRMIRQYTADDLINDVIKEVEREKEENDESGSQEARFENAFAGGFYDKCKRTNLAVKSVFDF